MDSSLSLNGQASRAFFEAFAPAAGRFVQPFSYRPRAGEGWEGARDAAGAAVNARVDPERRLSLLRQHGTFTLAYSATLQKGLEYFGDEHGFIAYKMVGGTALVLADPVAALDRRRELIGKFVQAKSDVCFWQVSRPTAEILASLDFAVNEMGTDIRLDLPQYKRKTLGNDFKRAVKDGYVTKECSAASVGIEAVKAVSDRWLQARKSNDREVCFLNRPLVLEDEPDVRKFFTFDRDGNLVAFAFYDPIYQDGEVAGYSTSFKRRVPETHPRICNAILHCALESFRAEGRKWLFLGLSPMADIEDKEFRHDAMVSALFRLSFRSRLFNRFVYPLQGHAAHKLDFKGVAEQTYCAFNTRFALPRTIKLLRACNMI